jgi:ParB family chromosome partitioning protein
MSPSDRKPSGLIAALESAQKLGAQDVAREDQRQEAEVRTRIPLDHVILRERDTRRLKNEHVQSLRNSIAALGLIEPIVVDLNSGLLAGGHRLAALRLLLDQEPETFHRLFPEGLVPVRQMSIDSKTHPADAMAIEVAENEQRRDYTAQEIRVLAQRLKDAGYRETPGRPKLGEKALTPALRTIVGKSFRTIRRVLADRSDETVPSGTISPEERQGRLRMKLFQRLSRLRVLWLQLDPPPAGSEAVFDQLLAQVGEPSAESPAGNPESVASRPDVGSPS